MPVTNFDQLATSAGALNPNVNDPLTAFIAGAQTTGTLKWQWLVPFAGTITDVRAWLETAPTGANFIADLNKNGTTVFSTQGNRPTIVAAAQVSSTTLPDIVSVAAGDRLSLDIDAIGSGVAGSNLSVAVTIKRGTVT